MKKVLLGLSGGVDSSVCAYLLNKNDYDVTCMFMRNWDSALNNDILGNDHINDSVCPQEADYMDAVNVSKHLNIPIIRHDFVEEYWNDVFTYFLDEYKKDRTPNPDILCNKYIKFKAFLDVAVKENYDCIAMGHYARKKVINGKAYLLKGKDEKKDQSYFLCMISQEALAKCIFPVGELTKQEVRKIASDNKIPTADKKDSTGICFIGERNFKKFLMNYLPASPGDIVTTEGECVGKHDGLMYYTIGQRKGLNIGGNNKYLASSWFVAGKNIKENKLIVVQINEEYLLYSNRATATCFHYITDDFIDNKTYTVKFRYQGKLREAKIIHKDNNEIELFYELNVQ